ncbi:MAG: MFS transporter [Acidimicrobiales bacterium]|nr:MFS transporter [Acidimicrobiales bacterium]MCB9371214.1 MFS transporter [Microthrixaceae bacterium]
MSGPEATPDAPVPAGHWNRSVVALLLSVFCASSAAFAGVTALGIQVFALTGRELDLGILGLLEFLPAALLVLVTGSVADRFDRRRVTAAGALGEAAVAALLAWYATTSPTAVLPIFALVVVFGTARAFAAPASRSLPADLMAPEDLPWLVARHSATWQLAIIFGPVLGGTLYAVDVALPYVAMVVLLVTAAVAVGLVDVRAGTVRPVSEAAEAPETSLRGAPAVDEAVLPEAAALLDEPAARTGWQEALEGLRFIRRTPVLLGAISLDLFAVLFGGAIALLPALADQRLGVGAVGLGWLRAAGGIGAGAVTLLLARRPLTRRVGRTLLVVVAVFGVGTVVLGVTTTYAVAFAAMVVLSGADAVSVFIRATLVPLVTPADKRGRVLAVENVFIGGSNELGAFESGVAGQLLGAAGAVVLGGAATVLIALGWWRWFPALRDVDRFPAAAAGPEAR